MTLAKAIIIRASFHEILLNSGKRIVINKRILCVAIVNGAKLTALKVAKCVDLFRVSTKAFQKFVLFIGHPRPVQLPGEWGPLRPLLPIGLRIRIKIGLQKSDRCYLCKKVESLVIIGPLSCAHFVKMALKITTNSWNFQRVFYSFTLIGFSLKNQI